VTQNGKPTTLNVFSYLFMAARIVSWSGNTLTVSQSLSKSPSIVSVDSILPDKLQAIQSAPRAAESPQAASQVIDLNGTRTLAATGMYPGHDTIDGSFVKHHRYFFTDGNVTFLVRDIYPSTVVCRLIDCLVCM
jgi:hypothetical protein